MSSTQISACCPLVELRSISRAFYPPASRVCISPAHVFQLPGARPRLVVNAANYQRYTPVCLFGGKGNTEGDSESSPWKALVKALEKAMGNFRKEPFVQDLLREQMQERQFDDGDGGSGNRSSGGGDGSGDSEDEGFAGILDELVQVILATITFILMYIYIIRGEELTRLASDYIRYLFGGRESVRLTRAMYVWGRFGKRLTTKKVVRNDWLEDAILNTPTWRHDPRRARRVRRPSYQ
ncbi:uncharacterized protein LOC143877216 [Tasmannia lanceolata]|uniref:uncharacterized protein LOC143877216 n=1 Tax=Tasmannia lanceolata TaxID=3420 RepID=UPI004063528A